ncbi:MAG TPA: methylmalonyl Co-A mutase-associated GTPase MeaB [Planctomycetota bacterium]|nr:methylmalonyl Co-A mutase-associated GTPase MeaB [Planctomycetota bacterium]
MLVGLPEDVLRGDFLALGRAISLVENGTAEGRRLLDAVASRVGAALRIGLTGPPGVGKSTAVDELTQAYQARGEKVGVLAVDPTSPFTGGALLGDRIRMVKSTEKADVFMRSMASRGMAGGLSRATQDAADLLDASGRTVILLETVGVGQSEVEVSRAADCAVLMLSPESGDGIQAMKSGVLEIADLVVINKADRGGADRLEHDLRTAFELGLKSRRDVPILLTQASAGKGIPEVVAAIDNLITAWKGSGAFAERRRRNMESRLRRIAEFLLEKDLWEAEGAAGRVRSAADEVLAGRRSPYEAARGLLQEALS